MEDDKEEQDESFESVIRRKRPIFNTLDSVLQETRTSIREEDVRFLQSIRETCKVHLVIRGKGTQCDDDDLLEIMFGAVIVDQGKVHIILCIPKRYLGTHVAVVSVVNENSVKFLEETDHCKCRLSLSCWDCTWNSFVKDNNEIVTGIIVHWLLERTKNDLKRLPIEIRWMIYMLL
jgi:hypothetical protein